MRNETNRLTPDQLDRLRKWLDEILGPVGDPKQSQRLFATKTGVSQSLISSLRNGGNTTRGTALDMLQRGGGDVDAVLGDGAGIADSKYRERDDMHARGFALDALSLVYEEDFCDTIQALTPPAGSDSWTTDAWVDHIVSMRKLWQSGHLRPKRLHSRSSK